MNEEKLYNLFSSNQNPKQEFSLNIDKYLKDFEKERRFDGRKSSTIKGDLIKTKVFLDFVNDTIKKPLNELNYKDFVEFFYYLQEDRKVSRNT